MIIKIGLTLTAIMLYTFAGAFTWGRFVKKFGTYRERGEGEDLSTFFGSILWPITMAFAVVWFGFIAPIIPAIGGMCRLGQGKTFFAPKKLNE